MDQTLKDLASWSIDHAKSAGADACRVRIGGERFVEIEYLERRPENIKEATTRGMGIDIYVNGRFSSQSTSDLRKDALQTFITSAVATTRLLAEDPYRTLPDPKYYEGRASADLQLLDAEYTGLTPERRHDLVKALEAASLEKGGDRIISVEASTYDTHHESIVLTSNGFEGGTEGTVFSMGASVTVKDEGDRRPADGAYVTCRSQKNLPQPTLVGTVAAERALSLLGGKKIDTATLPVIIENQGVPRLLYGLLAGMYGSNIDQQRSFLADKKGHPIASEHLTLIDDPLLPGGLGSRLFDGDGLSARTRTMIDKGILQDFFVDWYYSRKLGWEPTTGGPSNLIIPPGKRSLKEIMRDLGKGIFVTGFIGGNSNSTTGDTSVGILGQLFENGEPVQAVAEMNIAGNHLEFWKKLAEVANDPFQYSSAVTPSLVFTDVVVSGV